MHCSYEIFFIELILHEMIIEKFDNHSNLALIFKFYIIFHTYKNIIHIIILMDI